MRRTVRVFAGLLLGTLPLAGPADAAADPAVHVPGADPPPVLERITSFEGLTALAISPDLERVAVARLVDAQGAKSSLELLSAAGDAPIRIVVAGVFRDLLFDTGDAPLVYGVLHKSARKHEGDTHLAVWDPERGKLRRAIRLPPSARSIDHWTVRNALLVTATDELRTLLLPDLRSGPLFSVGGENIAVSAIAGGNLVLVGQRQGVVLVNLTDPPGQFEMPIRGSVGSPAPIVALASSPDGSEALARLEDGRLFAVGLDPLSLTARGSSQALVSVEGRDEPTPAESSTRTPETTTAAEPSRDLDTATAGTAAATTAAAAAAVAAVAAVADDGETGEERIHEPSHDADTATAGATATETAVADTDDGETGEEQTTHEPSRDLDAATAGTAAATTAVADADDGGAGEEERPATAAREPQIHGRLEGPAHSAVHEVVILGPDSILREAARVTPDADGNWETDGLEPGRYRVQLDGGGGRVLVSDPPFLLIDLTDDGGPVSAPTLRVIRSL